MSVSKLDSHKLLKKMNIREKLNELAGQEVNVYIDRPIGFIHPQNNDIIYPINYGYIKEIIAADNEYQDAYVLGENKPTQSCIGKVYAIVEREDDIEDKLIITTDNYNYSIEDIRKKIHFQEKYFDYKIKIII